MKGIDRLYAGDYNVCSQAWQSDGSCVVTLFSTGDDVAVAMHIDELHGAKELVLVEVELPFDAAPYVKARQAAAIEAAERGR